MLPCRDFCKYFPQRKSQDAIATSALTYKALLLLVRILLTNTSVQTFSFQPWGPT